MPSASSKSAKRSPQTPWNRPLSYALLVGCAALVLRAAVIAPSWTAFTSQAASAALLAGAAGFVGVLGGFVFGIPRTVARDGESVKVARLENGAEDKLLSVESAAQSGIAVSARGFLLQTNTNLEQISDWLTKILIGVGLVQLGQVPHALETIAEYQAPALGKGPSASAFAASTIVYFGICGFLLGYLWTRLYLTGQFRAAGEDIGAEGAA